MMPMSTTAAPNHPHTNTARLNWLFAGRRRRDQRRSHHGTVAIYAEYEQHPQSDHNQESPLPDAQRRKRSLLSGHAATLIAISGGAKHSHRDANCRSSTENFVHPAH